MNKTKTWIKQYIGFVLGTVFGAVIATITSYFIFILLDGDIEQTKLLNIQDCLEEKLEV